MNCTLINGNLTRDIELRYAPSGTAIANFTIANNRTYMQGTEKKEEVSFIGVTAFGKQAETVAKFFKKGSPILVRGRLKQEEWGEGEQRRSKTVVVMEEFEFMGGKREDSGSAPAARPASRPPASSVPTKSQEPDEDDVPF